ncbi:hypothetical protein PGB34_20580 [Xenophilus arseniciresistens]|uniref:Uncharacterized protein n=1 Tax=Xenophilus arseniciresistens TaxID=1283306 RepID=A0AAE3T2U0_9BURK|nr:hypothetical protein [Xenophilus arseniciresistens]MDA7418777.1 hypothetical protein [Xenophilus arseniciresistens]
MHVAWILLAVAIVFAIAAFWKRARMGRPDIAARIWLRVALIFTAVGLWLLWNRA